MALDIDAAVEDFWLAPQRGKCFPAAYADRLSLGDGYRMQLAIVEDQTVERWKREHPGQAPEELSSPIPQPPSGIEA